MTIAPFLEPVVLEVYGLPAPQGSKSAVSRGGKTWLIEGKSTAGRQRFTDWRDAVSAAARSWQAEHHAALLDEPCELTIVFRLPRPPSAPKRRVWPDRTPDVDKLVRLVGDAITNTLITNDSRICVLHARKVYAVDAPPGATITLEILE